MMKIVINKCFGGFGLSTLAVKRLAQLNGRDCFFYDRGTGISDFVPVSKLQEVEDKLDNKPAQDSLYLSAFDIPNFHELYAKATKGKQQNDLYEKHYLSASPDDRTDPKLIQVVEELGAKADGSCAKLKIINIPDGVDWEIDEYDGQESVSEKHRSWS
jgi:hypothetical protein